jgi:sirohydrochlorin cobaltochelatase
LNEFERLFQSLLAKRTSRIGQVEITAAGEGFVLFHRDDGGRKDLTSYNVDGAFEVAKFDDAGNYRPLKTAPTLRHGWKIVARDAKDISRAIDAIYPGRLAILRSFDSGKLKTTSLRETLSRQSGMYRVAAKISDQQIDGLVGDFCCSDGGCLRTILWRRDQDETIPSNKLPPEKFDPAVDQTGKSQKCIPLLCQEVCNLLVAACREKVKAVLSSPPDDE